MTTFKSIAYAFPTSPMARELGFNDTGCFYVQLRKDNHTAGAAHNCEGFLSPDDSDLIAFYHECEGVICPYFKQYGNVHALRAIAKG